MILRERSEKYGKKKEVGLSKVGVWKRLRDVMGKFSPMGKKEAMEK